ncbi:MAG TPA: phosphatidate cytidylyltransferase, partial [Planctomycetaceae bacterium]|nr:phosphatidate cytidylyltransferase [Planctomycetaceae bacterium]
SSDAWQASMTVPELSFLPGTQTISKGEICRKFLHMTPGLLPFLFAPLRLHPDPLDATSLAVVVLVCAVLTLVFLALRPVVRRPGERNFLSTTLSYPASILAVLLLFPGRPEFAMVVVVVLAFGDGSAWLAGRLFGRRRLPWNPEKTWVGSTAFVCCSAPLAALAFWLEARPPVSFPQALVCGLAAALAGAAAESLPSQITDNARVGVAAGVAVAVTGLLVA